MAKKHRPVQVLIKPASADCNLACEYCFYLKKAGLYPETDVHRMPGDVQEEMTRQILRYGGATPAFAYQGGEPTLMGLDWFQRGVDLQMQMGTGQQVANSIQTNGILIDDAWAAFLARYRFLVGLSLDGPARIHDQFRQNCAGKGSHAQVERAARLLDAHGAEYNILSVVNSVSENHAAEIYRYYRDLGCAWMQFIPAVEHDPETGELAPFSPTPEGYGKFLCEIFDEWKKDFRNGRPTVSVRLFDSLMAGYCGMPAPSCALRKQCGIYVVVEHNGDVYSCDFFVDPEWKLGNLMEKSLRTMIESPKQREFGARKAQLPEKCLTCDWRWLCTGGCPKDRMRSGQPGELGVDYFCEAWKMFFEHSRETFETLKPIIMAEQAQNAPRHKTTKKKKKR